MPRALLLFLLLFALGLDGVSAINLRYAPLAPPKPTKAPSRNGTNISNDDLKRRQAVSVTSVCGYYNGDPEKARTADPGFGCRLDIDRGLWGFCPTTVISAKDCGLAGNCVDSQNCKSGCGKTGIAGLTTFTCATDRFCSTVILEGGFEGGFSYIACGNVPTIETLFKEAITTTETPTSIIATTVRIIPTDATTIQSTTLTSSLTSSPTSTTSSGVSSSATQPTSPASQTTSPIDGNKSSSDGSSNTGAIVGGVVGGVAIICVTVVVAIYIMRRNKRTTEEESQEKKRGSRFRSWGRSSSKPPNYEQSEAVRTDAQGFDSGQNKMYAGWGPSEVYGSEPRRDPTAAPVELPGASPVELPSRRG
ncbi:hypothetical protein HER10_EVM0011311 [Colletotrichum scovillei]|uniref:Syndecan domain containing protein n=1 Tax=Colletotrichum scovillei TaxID=1209932 RepID=A0A9P7REZ5_9PEZI|nr:uncharacterized protein HER10_EVM0011311 [Colletotrichum scovillei]KAF4785904.1 hypothetical protein HER10_EVM0011311 [Colletotrichum scovillei]KAG7055453.1 Syndecan domain containing protein [Colletotrichum scovillei]KAG7074897.1 Syndecan domain containing protein [Colletotrichum scovillei]KAG7082033.1 Syndecan domain containing protein [Colletotrichum scovillei]